jgi:hypothetical protein
MYTLGTGVEITTRQLAKCKWNLELASIFWNLLASLASVFFLLSVSLFVPANWILFLPDSKIDTHTWHFDLFTIMTHTQSWWSIFRAGLVQTKCTLYKCSAKTWFWRVFSDLASKILSYSPVWRMPLQFYFHPCLGLDKSVPIPEVSLSQDAIPESCTLKGSLGPVMMSLFLRMTFYKLNYKVVFHRFYWNFKFMQVR